MLHPPYHPLERDPAHTSLTIARADSSHLSRAEIEHSWYWVEQALLHAVRGDEHGARAASYTEEQGVAAMAPSDIVIRVELNRGDARTAVWTTDFSYDYVKINAEYRT